MLVFALALRMLEYAGAPAVLALAPHADMLAGALAVLEPAPSHGYAGRCCRHAVLARAAVLMADARAEARTAAFLVVAPARVVPAPSPLRRAHPLPLSIPPLPSLLRLSAVSVCLPPPRRSVRHPPCGMPGTCHAHLHSRTCPLPADCHRRMRFNCPAAAHPRQVHALPRIRRAPRDAAGEANYRPADAQG